MLTAARLREVLDYEPNTGEFRWRAKQVETKFDVTFNKRFAGKRAGSVAPMKHQPSYSVRIISVDGERFIAARLAWLYMTGSWPAAQIDHEDRDSLNDAWSNLRSASASENSCNRKRYSNNKSGVTGVTWNKQMRKWEVKIMVRRVQYRCGMFSSLEEATKVREAKTRELHGAFANFDVASPTASLS